MASSSNPRFGCTHPEQRVTNLNNGQSCLLPCPERDCYQGIPADQFVVEVGGVVVAVERSGEAGSMRWYPLDYCPREVNPKELN